MSRRIPAARAPHVTKARQVLSALLRTPKTRSGLVAAVKTAQISKHFVFGFLSEGVLNGTLTLHKSVGSDLYQLTSHFHTEVPAPSEYPSWLDPRTLPGASQRRVFFNGKPAAEQAKDDDEAHS